MKKINILLVLLSGLLIVLSCNDDYMERYPENAVSDGSVWKTPADLKLYVNNFYNFGDNYDEQLLWRATGTGHIGIFTLDRDNGSDTQIPKNYSQHMNGQTAIPANGGGWNVNTWKALRNINYFFANYRKAEGDQAEIDRYVGEALFFRAVFYFRKLCQFGDVPWYEDLLVPYEENLFNKRDPRNFVVDKLMEDLDKAVSYLPSRTTWDGRVNKETAMLLQARIALYEGTWEKYHAGTVFGVEASNGEKYLEKAKAVTDQLIALGTCGLDNVGVKNGYQLVFNQKNYSNSKEVLFWREYNQSMGLGHAWSNFSTYGAETGLTRRMIDMYLCSDGKPIGDNPLYKGDNTLVDIVADRDPRLNQTIYVNDGEHEQFPGEVFQYPAFEQLGKECITGYQLYKGHVPALSLASSSHETAMIYFRYAEALLINAEAKAELGTITQSDIDNTINQLRRRLVVADDAQMADMKLEEVNALPASSRMFPSLSNIINEIRRERTVELAAEGFRVDDIFRWAAADILIKGYIPQGAKVAQWQGDLNPEPSSGFTEAVTGLKTDAQGYITPYAAQTSFPQTGYNFNLNRDYLRPLPTDQLTLNQELKQNPGWE